MNTRVHWGDSDGHRTCNHAQHLRHSEVSAAEFLKLPNLCRTCERAAQKAEALSVLRAFGTGKPKILPVPQWPEPRPIEEAPNTAILAWCPATEELTEGWEVVYPSNQPGWWCGNGELHQPTHFLPLPPKPEVRK